MSKKKDKLVMCFDCKNGKYKGGNCSLCSLEINSSLKNSTELRNCNQFKSIL